MGIFDLVSDVVKLAVAPVEIAANLTRVVTAPMVEVAEEIVEETEAMVEDE